MANAIPIQIADAVAKELNAHTFTSAPSAFTVVRSTGSWDDDFKGLSSLQADVVYRKRGTTISFDTQSSIEFSTEIIIALRQRFDPAKHRSEVTGEILNTAVDPNDTLLVDIAKFIVGRRAETGGVLSDLPCARYDPSREIVPSLANEEFLRRSLYYAFIPLYFLASEDI